MLQRLRSFFAISTLNNRFAVLHGFRSLVILGVIQVHVTLEIHTSRAMNPLNPNPNEPYNWWETLSFNGWFVMDSFFIMSGFLIGHILFHTQEQTKFGWGAFKRFYLRRGFRTFPLYYVFILGYYTLNKFIPVVTTLSQSSFKYLHYNELVYLTNYPFSAFDYLAYWSWSLSLEEHFYLLSPFIIYGLACLPSHRARMGTLIGVWASGLVVRLFIYYKFIAPSTDFDIFKLLYTPTHARYDTLFVGILMAYLYRHFWNETKAFIAKRWVQIAGLLLAAGIFTVFSSPEINPYPLDSHSGNLQEQLWSAWTDVFYFGTMTGVVYFILMMFCLFTDNWFTRFLSARSFLYLASLGYGTYLVHMPVATQVVRYMNTVYLDSHGFEFWAVAYVLTTFFSVALAYLLHLLVEKPFLYIRDRFAS